jgi:glycosyltransferase involved in cell wall biosynthesis
MQLPFRGLTRAIAYENFEVPKHHDVVITTGATSKAVIHRPYQRRYHLLHTPARWLFDLGPGQYNDDRWPVRWIKRGFQSVIRVHDQSTIPRIDDFVVNSEVIARRLQTYHRREETAVIYPPVDLSSYNHEPNEGFLLYLGRLEPHKRVGEIVDAVTGTEYDLRIAGAGSTEEELRERAGDNVDFLGFVTEERKRELLARCDALLFNSEHEDFGIVPVEAMASGNPVVGVAEGFTKYQIEDGVNGVLFERGVENMRKAIDRVYSQEWDSKRIQTSADRYGMERFENQWRSLVYDEER